MRLLESSRPRSSSHLLTKALIHVRMRRMRGEIFEQRACERSGCGMPFIPKRRHQRYCSTKCRLLGWDQEKFDRGEFIRECVEAFNRLPYKHPWKIALRSATYSEMAKKQTPHGPGTKKRKS